MRQVLRDVVVFTEYGNRKTVTTNDVSELDNWLLFDITDWAPGDLRAAAHRSAHLWLRPRDAQSE